MQKEVLVFPNPSLMIIFGIQRKKIVDHYRRQGRQGTLLSDMEYVAAGQERIARGVTEATLGRLVAQETVTQLLEGMSLSPLQQDVLTNLLTDDPQSVTDLARKHSVEPVTVRVCKNRLLKRLRDRATALSLQ